jgi:hypothetical protein
LSPWVYISIWAHHKIGQIILINTHLRASPPPLTPTPQFGPQSHFVTSKIQIKKCPPLPKKTHNKKEKIKLEKNN